MCEYMIFSENGMYICKPKNQWCTMCVFGNMKTYDEIKDKEKQYEKKYYLSR